MKKIYLIVLIILAITAGGVMFFVVKEKQYPAQTNVNTANVNATSTNKNTNTPQGQKFSAHLYLTTPVADDIIESPLKISGAAAGWYFEASFPIKLVDANGKILVSGEARATSDWMTENFVPFTSELKFSKPATLTGMLILKKDNPSGDPSRDEEVDVPVRFSSSSVASCHPTGCSAQICSDKNMITNCIYLPEYACYKNAKCERQSDGNCGWTQTQELKNCLNQSKK